jgi:hypothetical protein
VQTEEIVYLLRDNTIALSLSTDNVAIAHNSITRCQVTVGATLIDSNVSPTWFDLTQTDRLVLKFGASGLTAGRYTATLMIFDATHTLGLVWGQFVILVR